MSTRHTPKYRVGMSFKYGKISTLQSRPMPGEKPESTEHIERLMRLAENIHIKAEPRSLCGSSLSPKQFEF